MSRCKLFWIAAFTMITFAALVANGVGAVAERTIIVAKTSRFATPCYELDSGVAGPVVMVVGGIHGNEPAGVQAAETIRRWPIVRGKLIVLPAANLLALKAQTRRIPNEDESLSDLNRNFPRKGQPNRACGPLAEAIWQLVEAEKPDWLIDLHESANFRLIPPNGDGNSVLTIPTPETNKAAGAVLEAINATIPEPGKQFSQPRPPKDGSLARAAAEQFHIPTLLFETTRKDQPLELRVEQHRMMARRLLEYLKMME